MNLDVPLVHYLTGGSVLEAVMTKKNDHPLQATVAVVTLQ